MPNDYFQFKQFLIRQSGCAMKVGTDGVLLGAWSDVSGAKHILDIGTGTGLIALMLAQRAPEALIHAIDIDADAYRQASENVAASKFEDRVEVLHSSLQAYAPSTRYNLIVTNPPYFRSGTRSPDKRRAIARTDDHLSTEELCSHAWSMSEEQGRLCLVQVAEEADFVIDCARDAGWHLEEWLRVIPRPQAEAKRVLLSFSKEPNPTREGELILELERHQYSPEYRALTQDFYLDRD